MQWNIQMSEWGDPSMAKVWRRKCEHINHQNGVTKMSSTGCPGECVKQHCMAHVERQQSGCKERDRERQCVTGSESMLEKTQLAPGLWGHVENGYNSSGGDRESLGVPGTKKPSKHMEQGIKVRTKLGFHHKPSRNILRQLSRESL